MKLGAYAMPSDTISTVYIINYPITNTNTEAPQTAFVLETSIRVHTKVLVLSNQNKQTNSVA
jgi:hypothetical protein